MSSNSRFVHDSSRRAFWSKMERGGGGVGLQPAAVQGAGAFCEISAATLLARNRGTLEWRKGPPTRKVHDQLLHLHDGAVGRPERMRGSAS